MKGPLRERKDNQGILVPDTSLWDPLVMGVCFGPVVLVWVRVGDRARTETPCWCQGPCQDLKSIHRASFFLLLKMDATSVLSQTAKVVHALQELYKIKLNSLEIHFAGP